MEDNQYNYEFDLTTWIGIYENSKGRSYWAISQLISAYQNYEFVKSIITIAMEWMGGAIGSGSSKSSSLNTQVNGQTRDVGCYIK